MSHSQVNKSDGSAQSGSDKGLLIFGVITCLMAVPGLIQIAIGSACSLSYNNPHSLIKMAAYRGVLPYLIVPALMITSGIGMINRNRVWGYWAGNVAAALWLLSSYFFLPAVFHVKPMLFHIAKWPWAANPVNAGYLTLYVAYPFILLIGLNLFLKRGFSNFAPGYILQLMALSVISVIGLSDAVLFYQAAALSTVFFVAGIVLVLVSGPGWRYKYFTAGNVVKGFVGGLGLLVLVSGCFTFEIAKIRKDFQPYAYMDHSK